MCPAPAKTTDFAVRAAALDIVARRGVDGLSLRGVAAAVGVQAPSLYKRYHSREALLRAIREDAKADLFALLRSAKGAYGAPMALTKVGAAYRAFGLANPEIYRLLHRHDLGAADGVALGLFGEITTELLGDVHGLDAARCLAAFLHGFVTMEIDGTMIERGSADEAFSYSIYALLQGLSKSAASSPPGGVVTRFPGRA